MAALLDNQQAANSVDHLDALSETSTAVSTEDWLVDAKVEMRAGMMAV